MKTLLLFVLLSTSAIHAQNEGLWEGYDGEWSHVHVSDDVMGRPYTWLAEVAHRVYENGPCHCEPSPSGRSTRALLESVTAGVP